MSQKGESLLEEGLTSHSQEMLRSTRGGGLETVSYTRYTCLHQKGKLKLKLTCVSYKR